MLIECLLLHPELGPSQNSGFETTNPK
ncbi:hypothetical protein F383_25872 [Gossypium arboreum]|uniref:Uncharacterized protein n=1 Tax=Gossypium arboreum TaxID=29729 RepID=A0A0B0MMN8_GOSAR|nr:hypothetical protein F383_25872 [Gossypium arboreum]